MQMLLQCNHSTSIHSYTSTPYLMLSHQAIVKIIKIINDFYRKKKIFLDNYSFRVTDKRNVLFLMLINSIKIIQFSKLFEKKFSFHFKSKKKKNILGILFKK